MSDYQLSRRYFLGDARCKDGTDVPVRYLANAEEVARDVLEPICDRIGERLAVHSWFRTDTHNKKRGGKKSSHHLTAKAVDVKSRLFTPEQLLAAILKMHAAGELPRLGGVGIYDTFVHVDVARAPDGHLRRWDERTKKGGTP